MLTKVRRQGGKEAWRHGGMEARTGTDIGWD